MSRLLPTTLTGRLVLTAVGLVAVVSLLVAVAATLIMQSTLNSRLDDQLAEAVDRAQAEIGRGPGGPGPSGPEGPDRVPLALGQSAGTVTVLLDDDGIRGSVITTDGRRQDLPAETLDALASLPADGEPRSVTIPDLGDYRAAAVTSDDGLVIGALPTGDVEDTIASLIAWEVALTLGGTLVAGAGALLLVRRQLRPLRSVAAAADEVTTLPLSHGRVDEIARVPETLTDSQTEVGRVGEALNRMIGHVEQALTERHDSEQRARQFLADASHELRTPLSTIRGYTELARRGGDEELALDKVEAEAGRMSHLVEDMFLLARLDAGRPLLADPVDAAQVLAEAVNDARVVHRDHRWSLGLPDEPVIVTGDAQRLHQALSNLLTNAARHTPDGTRVTATAGADSTHAVIEVRDEGPGIPADLLPRIFDRFTRGDGSRTRASGGAGLGTALVKAIAEAHGGSADVDSAPGSTTFRIRLPLAR